MGLQGQAAYTHSADAVIGDAKGDNVDRAWHVVRFEPTYGLTLPSGIDVRDLPDAGGFVFVDALGHTLYAYHGRGSGQAVFCSGKSCQDRWLPLKAPEIGAMVVGDFSVTAGIDGSKQWAYRGRPLYTFERDLEPGSVKGKGVGPDWHPALFRRHYMPAEVTVLDFVDFGTVMAEAKTGKTIYHRDRFRFDGGSGRHQIRGQVPMTGLPRVGAAIGVGYCDAECAKVWKPLVPATGAQPQGRWLIYERKDGVQQWAYEGYALYTYAGDEKPGDTKGHNIFDIVVGDGGRYSVADAGSVGGGGALYWHVVFP